MRKYYPKFAILIAMLFLVLFAAMPAMAASGWASKSVRFSAVAGEALSVGDVVCISGADGKAYKADANDASLRPAVGVIGKGGAAAATTEIVVQGILTGQSAASPGARLFLSETAGAIASTAPANAQNIGWVLPGSGVSSTRYFINIQAPSSGGAGY